MKKGKLYVVGTGPGGLDHLTPAAREAVKKSDVIIGYKTYLDLIPDLLSAKEVVSSEMRKEVDRTRQALIKASEGQTVSLVSGGDPGIYAMAGLVFEMAKDMDTDISIEVIPGIAALNSCAAVLGAPLMHDFCAISLSDLLTPWELIQKRLKNAADADFVIVIYNPKSKKRQEHIVTAREIIMKCRASETPVGVVTNATRSNQSVTLTTLDKMLAAEIGMQSTVIVGNSKTFSWNGHIVTPRGYKDKYGF